MIARATGLADATEQERLKLAEGDLVLRVTRVRGEYDGPARYESCVLPLTRFPGLTPESDLHEDVVTLARAHGVTICRASETVDTVDVPWEVAEHLRIDPDEPVLRVERIVRATGGVPIEWCGGLSCSRRTSTSRNLDEHFTKPGGVRSRMRRDLMEIVEDRYGRGRP